MVSTFRLDANILEALHLENLPEDQKTELLQKMTEVIQGRIVDRLLERLTETQKQKFDALIEANATPEQVEQFLRASIPTFDDITAEETLRFKDQMVSDADTVRQMVMKQ